MKGGFVVALLLILAFASPARAQTVIERADLATVFAAEQVVGTFALLDVASNELIVVNAARAQQRFIPASTFKFANALIALEVGAVADEREIIPYGGGPQPIQAWESDMTLGEAFALSNVPVFQNVARRVGQARYSEFLGRLSYGNASSGDVVDRFWLDGPLAISAVEQTRFLAELAANRLPVSQRAQQLVQTMSVMESAGGAVLHGKTGWTTAPNPSIGWFVGWVERQERIYAFALNMDMPARAQAPLRVSIARTLLQVLNVY